MLRLKENYEAGNIILLAFCVSRVEHLLLLAVVWSGISRSQTEEILSRSVRLTCPTRKHTVYTLSLLSEQFEVVKVVNSITNYPLS